jgi:hypothetical protein
MQVRITDWIAMIPTACQQMAQMEFHIPLSFVVKRRRTAGGMRQPDKRQ